MDCCPAALCTPCLQRAAKAQGSLFRCPLCRDDGALQRRRIVKSSPLAYFGVDFVFATTPRRFAAMTNAPSSRQSGQRNKDPCALAARDKQGVQSAAGQQSMPSPASPQTRHGVIVMARGPGALCGAISLRRRLMLSLASLPLESGG